VKDKMEKFYYLCIGFSPMIWQQQKHLLSHMMKYQFSNLDALPRYDTHFLQKPNLKILRCDYNYFLTYYHVWTLDWDQIKWKGRNLQEDDWIFLVILMGVSGSPKSNVAPKSSSLGTIPEGFGSSDPKAIEDSIWNQRKTRGSSAPSNWVR
jgi:hypothetical protein